MAAPRLAVRKDGTGPVVLLIHGWAGSKDTWGPMPALLAGAGFGCVAVDLPGWGESPARRRHPHSVESYAEALHPLLERLGPVHLVAHSMGVQVALLAARARPEPQRLVLLAPPVLPVRGLTLPPRTLVDLVTFPVLGVPTARLAMSIMKHRPPAPETRYRRTVADAAALGRPEAAEIIRRSTGLFEATSTRTMARALRSTARADMRPVAVGVTVPTLVVTGDSDRVIHPREASVLADVLPHADLAVIESTGHLPHLEAADKVSAMIVAHLRGD